jgi:hypothetical protein
MIASPKPSTSSRIVVGDGSLLAVTHTGHHPTLSSPLSLSNVLVSPHLIKNLVSVKKLTRDNPINIEFDNLGFLLRIGPQRWRYSDVIPPGICILHHSDDSPWPHRHKRGPLAPTARTSGTRRPRPCSSSSRPCIHLHD